jgi:hypothetical protein
MAGCLKTQQNIVVFLTLDNEEIGPSRDKAVPALSHLIRKRGSILSQMEGSQPAEMTFS